MKGKLNHAIFWKFQGPWFLIVEFLEWEFFAFSKSSSYVETKSSKTKRNALSWTFSIFFVLHSEQKCQDNGQKLKFDSIKEWKIVNLLSLFRCLPSLFMMSTCCTAFRHKLEICRSYLSEKSRSTPNNFTESSHVMLMLPMLKTGCLSCVLYQPQLLGICQGWPAYNSNQTRRLGRCCHWQGTLSSKIEVPRDVRNSKGP